VYAKARKKCPLESETRFPDGHAREEIGVHIEAEVRIETSCGERSVSLPECARLMQEESAIQVPPSHKGGIAVFLNHLIIRVDSV
jgi:hypothetical protein